MTPEQLKTFQKELSVLLKKYGLTLDDVAEKMETTSPSASAVAFEAFSGDVHVYALKDSNGKNVVSYDYFDDNNKLQSLKIVSGDGTGICVLDLKNTSGVELSNWKVNFSCPSLNIKGNLLTRGVVTQSSNGNFEIACRDRLTVNSTLPTKIVFVCNLPEGKAPVFINYKLSNVAADVPAASNATEVTKLDPRAKFNYKDIMYLNLYGMTWQTSGKKPAWNDNPHRGDCFLDDGQVDAKRDLSGGFHDAGDAIKVGYALGINCSMFAWCGLFYPKSLADAKTRSLYDNVLKQYCDYFVKCTELKADGSLLKYWHWVSDNKTDHTMGKPPELQAADYKAQNKYRRAFAIGEGAEKGTEPCAATAAGLAFTSKYFADKDANLAQQYLKYAKALYNYSEQNQAKYTARYVYESSSGYFDELCLGAIALHMATGEKSYLDKACSYYDTKIGQPSNWTWMVDNSSTICTLLLAYLTGRQDYKTKWNSLINDTFLPCKNGIKAPPNSPLRAVNDWGVVPQSAVTFGMAVMASDRIPGCENPAAIDQAFKILNYILGDNPRKYSYLMGFGEKFPRDPHHRSVHNNRTGSKPERLIGTGLFVAGEALNGVHNDVYSDAITNESGCYNHSTAMLIASLIR